MQDSHYSRRVTASSRVQPISLPRCDLLLYDLIQSPQLLDPLGNLRQGCEHCATHKSDRRWTVRALAWSRAASQLPAFPRTSARVLPSCWAPTPLLFISSRWSHRS